MGRVRNTRLPLHCPSFRDCRPGPVPGAFFVCGHMRSEYGLGMSEDYTDAHLREILTRARTIAVVGMSLNEVRPSFFVARYLSLKGYRVIPVNPGHAGKEAFGETVRATLSDIQEPVDMVDIFRRSDHVPPLVEEAMASLEGLRTIWMQIGVEHAEAAALARGQGVDVIMNRCPKIEYQRLFGELRKGGFNTGVISSKL